MCSAALHAQTIEEKRETLLLQHQEQELKSLLGETNSKLSNLRHHLQEKCDLVNQLYLNGANEAEYVELLHEVNETRLRIHELEKEWHSQAVRESKKGDEGYALWDQDETSLSQLIMEYGSPDFLYVIPPEVLSMKLNLHSEIPIPRESWSELLEIILSHNGIGIKKLNAYTRQLYILKQDLASVDHILNLRSGLNQVPPKSRVAYVFSPPAERIKGVSQFFERFRDPKMTFVYQVGYKIAIISSKEEVEKLLALYEAVWEKENEKLTRVLPLSRLNPEEMEKILAAYFGDFNKKSGMNLTKSEGEELTLFPLKNEGSIVLIGPKDMVEKAEKIVKDTEGQIQDPMEMTVFWYTCRHSDPKDIADILEKVYLSLLYAGSSGSLKKSESDSQLGRETGADQSATPRSPSSHPPSFVQPPAALPGAISSHKESSSNGNFIPDPKTGSLMMVVRRDLLDKIKSLLRRLDVPKKMVQIEVLLFEKRMKNQNNFGLNLLRLGSSAEGAHKTGLTFNTRADGTRKGILDFFIFRKKPSDFWPAFDIAYNFLMSQEDISINAAPSVTTLNQTPAQISLVTELSIDNGAAPIDSNQGTAFQKSYTRSQYGTTVVITPTIHDPDSSNEDHYFITLETNVTFDTIKKNTQEDRPVVSRRHIENQVRVEDGETIILGGLREKNAEDTSRKLPFLGEIPGLGKLFGDSRMSDEKTEMFLLITPKIVFDAKGESEKIKREALMRRPGDLPEYVEKIEQAKNWSKHRLMGNSFKLLFGHVNE